MLDNPLGERGTGLQGVTTGEKCWLGGGRSHTGDSHESISLGATSPGAQEQNNVALLNIVICLRLPGTDACSFEGRSKILSALKPCILIKETLRARLHVLSK